MASLYEQSPTAMRRLAEGKCPECGHNTDEHTGWGGPNGCTLTDNGVAQRIHAYRQSKENPSA